MIRKPNIDSAVAIGKSLAASALTRRRKAERTRKRALADLPAPVPHGIPHGVVSRTKAKSPKPAPTPTSAGLLIAEGDSWFDYPFHDVLSDLEDIYGFDVESVAHWACHAI